MTARTSAADLVPTIARIYAVHAAGCCWHVVLDDGNTDRREYLDNCAALAFDGGHEPGDHSACVDLARAWTSGGYSMTQIRKAIGLYRKWRDDMREADGLVSTMARDAAAEIDAEVERRIEARILERGFITHNSTSGEVVRYVPTTEDGATLRDVEDVVFRGVGFTNAMWILREAVLRAEVDRLRSEVAP